MSEETRESAHQEGELTPAQKEKLLKELKERLQEIERLKRELEDGVHDSPAPEENLPSMEEKKSESQPVSFGRVREEVEELRVPPLELLDDKPLVKKKKLDAGT